MSIVFMALASSLSLPESVDDESVDGSGGCLSYVVGKHSRLSVGAIFTY